MLVQVLNNMVRDSDLNSSTDQLNEPFSRRDTALIVLFTIKTHEQVCSNIEYQFHAPQWT